jgi:hypothetical protein
MSEGFRRLRLISKWLMLFGTPLGLLLWICVSVMMGRQLGLEELAILAGLPLVAGSLLLLLVWIFKGFSLRTRDSS